MVVGVLEGVLAVPALSLKEKRSVVKRVVQRTRNTFNVSVAEVDLLDTASAAVLGVTAVSSDARYVEGLLMKVETFIDELHVAEITDSSHVVETF